MSAVPAEPPVMIPEDEPTEATIVLLEDQVPPVDVLAAVIDEPTQTLVGPEIASGSGFTVAIVVMPQPVANR